MPRGWSSGDLALVDDSSLTVPEVARLTGRTKSSVEHMSLRREVDRSARRGSGLKRGDDNPWSDAELALLSDTELSLVAVSAFTGRSYGAVKAMASRQRIARIRPWSDAELDLLADTAISLVEVAERIGRKIGSVYAEASLRGIERGPQAGARHYRWAGGAESNSSWRGDDWPVIRLDILERDGYTCRDCGFVSFSGGRLNVHHVIPYRLRPINDSSWLVTLCKGCHISRPEHRWTEIPEHVEAQLACEGR